MKQPSSIQIQFRRETAAFMALVILFFLCISGIIEIFASNNWFLNIIPYPSPSITSTFPELDVKFQRLWKYGEPDCLFIGSSMTDTGLNPAVFEARVKSETNTDYNCFNMGFSSSMVEVSAAVTNSLTHWHNIKLIIWGISPIDMDPNFMETRSIVDMPVFAYNSGNPSFLGFLYNRFRLPWFLSTLPHLQNGVYSQSLRDFDKLLDNQGMRRTEKIHFKQLDSEKVMLPDFKIYPDDLKALQNYTGAFSAKGIKTVVVEMPVHPDFYPMLVSNGDESYQKDFIQPVQDALKSQKILFIKTQKDISSIVDNKTDWGNITHLNTNGSVKFTEYLEHALINEGILP